LTRGRVTAKHQGRREIRHQDRTSGNSFFNQSTKGNTMENVTMKVINNVLTITVDLKKTGTPSASGKSLVIATTRGIVPVPGNDAVKVGLNVFKSAH
jgi:hypothetical protein